jgi:hypothetical protein
MKTRSIFLVVLVIIPLLSGCRGRTDKSDQKSTELITARTLGLAYLEEFKLDEAEKEFLKFIKLAPDEKLGYANLGLTYLRMGRYPEAEKELLKAIKIDPSDPDTRLIMATVYEMDGKRDRSIEELKEALTYSPSHVKVLYQLSELYTTESGPEALQERESYLNKLVAAAPANLVPHLNLTDIYIRKGEPDKAMEQLEIIKKQFPEFPKESVEYYNSTIKNLKSSDKENAIQNFSIFHNYLKVTPPYQAGIQELKGPGGSLIGFPLITFDQQLTSKTSENESLLDVIKFTDATESAGLNIIPGFPDGEYPGYKQFTNVTSADFDGDGDIDLYAGSYDPSTSKYRSYLFMNEMGKFLEVTEQAGIKHTGKESGAIFADYDNDGLLDLYILKEGGDILYLNTGNGSFKDVTSSSKIGSEKGGNRALFFDLDHDGDLDLYEMTSDKNLQFRNNGDGTFTDQSEKMGMTKSGVISRDAAFGDFDEDEDIDLVVVNENSGNIFYSNQRLGVFRDMTAEAGLTSEGGSSSVSAGDYNNDGFLDLFITSYNPGGHMLYTNNGKGYFEPLSNMKEMFSSLENVIAYDAAFLDFNNDGFLDLLIAGESTEKDGRGLYLYYNDGKGGFRDVSNLLPANLSSGRQISVFDYNDDGDLDVLLAGLNGKVYLLRNDGGNNNHFISLKLVGLRAGSAKNNHFGIGAKVEIRAGELYQAMVVTDPNIHFGIGNRILADVIRITWTNGVPQNIFYPVTDQAAIEAQTLKGSCPFLYTWDGEQYIFVKDILWRSALGMPLGIMGGNTAYAFADPSDDYIKIPGELLKPRKGIYSVQLTDELWEIIYTDKLELIAVDHPDSVDIYVDEKFSPPPFPDLKVYQVHLKQYPASASDSEGNDLLPFITEKDDRYISGFKPDRYQGITEMQDLILDPGQFDETRGILLFLQGWIFPTDASINYALSQSNALRVVSPFIQVINNNGDWETVIDDLGFPMGKDKTVIADLTGKFLSRDHRIRIRTNMEIYWDRIFFSQSYSEFPVVRTKINPLAADLHYRGFSRTYRKGGRFGPHWFDYSTVDKGPKWRDQPGNYTRYGDVLPLITESDNKYVISNAGDEMTVEFDANKLPELQKGWKRDFLIRSVGWVKDGDMNTAYGNSVEPLPFHGMKSYPPSETDVYPDNPELQKYNREYNTRVVTSDAYLNAVKEYVKK